MRRIIVLSFFVALCVQSLAQQQAPADKPSREQVIRMMELMRGKQQLEGLMGVFSVGFRESFTAALKKQYPDAPAGLMKDLNAVLEDYMSRVVRECKDELLNELVVVYQQNLDRADVESIISFYSSAAGQKLLDKQPVLMQQGADAGRRVFQRKSAELNEDLKAKLEQLKEKYAPAQERQR